VEKSSSRIAQIRVQQIRKQQCFNQKDKQQDLVMSRNSCAIAEMCVRVILCFEFSKLTPLRLIAFNEFVRHCSHLITESRFREGLGAPLCQNNWTRRRMQHSRHTLMTILHGTDHSSSSEGLVFLWDALTLWQSARIANKFPWA
jgi:hypothetical protein